VRSARAGASRWFACRQCGFVFNRACQFHLQNPLAAGRASVVGIVLGHLTVAMNRSRGGSTQPRKASGDARLPASRAD